MAVDKAIVGFLWLTWTYHRRGQCNWKRVLPQWRKKNLNRVELGCEIHCYKTLLRTRSWLSKTNQKIFVSNKSFWNVISLIFKYRKELHRTLHWFSIAALLFVCERTLPIRQVKFLGRRTSSLDQQDKFWVPRTSLLSNLCSCRRIHNHPHIL